MLKVMFAFAEVYTWKFETLTRMLEAAVVFLLEEGILEFF
jgi:hypothetical protein